MGDEFNLPEIFEGQSFEEILSEMIESLPDDIDVSEGSHPYNLLAPTAYQKEYLVEYVLAEAVKLIFPKFCEGYDEIVDYHAEAAGIKRKEAFYATGELTITGETGVPIPVGSVFSTIETDEADSIEFESLEEAIIGGDGTVKVKIQAVEAGEIGNVSANTIVLQDDPVADEVTNETATTGGVNQESTESLIERIVEKEENIDVSFVGCDADYKRWAESVNGTGTASIIPPIDDSGLITIVLTDSLGKPASETLCQAVYNYIMKPDNRLERLAPPNALLEVVSPTTIPLEISAAVELEDGSTIETAKTEFIKGLLPYMDQIHDDMEVKYSKVASILSNTAGIYDFSDLLVNGGTVNIPIEKNEFPNITAESITFTEEA